MPTSGFIPPLPPEVLGEPIWKRFLKNLGDYFLPLAIAFIIFQYILGISFVIGSSMEPNFFDGDVVLFSRLSEVEHGDVVIIDSEALDEHIIKRVIAMQGDTVSIKEGVPILNGTPLEEPYLEYTSTDDMREISIPEGYCFVMGDNRGISLDSRDASVGLIPVDEIDGTSLIKF